MNRYEGLNLVDLLELLHEIVPPEPIALVPQTIGWWIALAWLVACFAFIVAAIVRHRRANRYRREAIAELARIEAQADAPEAPAALAALLKRTALAAYPRQQVASLYGSAWAAFLVDSSNGDAVIAAAADSLAHAAYREGICVTELTPASRRWIRRHRV